MTQKELLYMEDAIGHESSIIKIIENSINNLKNEDLISFMNEELQKHKNTKQSLINIMEEISNGW